jgi:hypothetical protein
MVDSILATLDPVIAAKVVAVLAILSGIKGLLNAFGNKENKIVVWFGKFLDVIGYNPAHK